MLLIDDCFGARREGAMMESKSGPFRVHPAWGQGANGSPRRCGWHVMLGDEWVQTYRLKRVAQEQVEKMNAEYAFGMAAVGKLRD